MTEKAAKALAAEVLKEVADVLSAVDEEVVSIRKDNDRSADVDDLQRKLRGHRSQIIAARELGQTASEDIEVELCHKAATHIREEQEKLGGESLYSRIAKGGELTKTALDAFWKSSGFEELDDEQTTRLFTYFDSGSGAIAEVDFNKLAKTVLVCAKVIAMTSAFGIAKSKILRSLEVG